jgi:hypothetical protein
MLRGGSKALREGSPGERMKMRWRLVGCRHSGGIVDPHSSLLPPETRTSRRRRLTFFFGAGGRIYIYIASPSLSSWELGISTVFHWIEWTLSSSSQSHSRSRKTWYSVSSETAGPEPRGRHPIATTPFRYRPLRSNTSSRRIIRPRETSHSIQPPSGQFSTPDNPLPSPYDRQRAKSYRLIPLASIVPTSAPRPLWVHHFS